MEFVFIHKKKRHRVEVKRCGFFGKFLGLTFVDKEDGEALLFEDLIGGIHSYFVGFDFLAVWLDTRDKVVKIEKVKPWRCYVSRKGERLLEIPCNARYRKIVGELIGKV